MTLASDVIIMESKWWMNVEVAVGYIITNYIVALGQQQNVAYYLDWSMEYDISPHSPVFGAATLTLVGIAYHYFLAVVTQVSRGRYESNFGNEEVFEFPLG